MELSLKNPSIILKMSLPLYSMLALQNGSSSITSPLLIYRINGYNCNKPAKSVDSSSSSSFELFVESTMQEDVYTLRQRSRSVCESSVNWGHHDG